MIQRGGQVVLRMLTNVQQKTIQPIIEAVVTKGSQLYTDEYDIYDRLPAWGYQHQTVCHSRGEYARDEDGDGFHEIHVNTLEGFWSLLRSWLRPHRGISQETTDLSWLLPIRSQRPQEGQTTARHAHRCPGRMSAQPPPRNPG
jgi:transposase